jgi:hypothetical protein
MRRWQLTAVLVVLAAAGIGLWTCLPPAGSPRPERPTIEPWPAGPEPVVDVIVTPPPTTLPPRSSPPQRPIVQQLPPDPAPVQYGCGGRAVAADEPVPECGQG